MSPESGGLPPFDEVLARIAAATPEVDESPGPVGEAVRALRERLSGADNLGESGDERDAYVLLDALTDAVALGYPGGHCRAGCSGCCDSQTAIFDVGAREWAAIERHVAEAWSQERREAFGARFAREHAPRLLAYRLLALIAYFTPVADAYFARYPYRCPFLEGGRCSIYAARPLACRMYGYFAVRSRWYLAPAVYGCGLQVAHYARQAGLTLPSVNMVVAQSRRLLGHRVRILPGWIARSRAFAPPQATGL